MLKKLITLFSLLIIVGCSDSGSGSGSDIVSCSIEGTMCTEMPAMDGAKDACEASEGTFGSGCPAGATATCTDDMGNGMTTTIYWYFAGATCDGFGQ